MSSYSFAEDWPGRRARGRKAHRHAPRDERYADTDAPRGPRAHRFGGAEGWAFMKEKGQGRRGRPTPEEIEELIAMRRMRGGPFGGPGGGPYGRGRGRGRGRARRGDVRLALLRLLGEEPANGYQLMQTIEERSGGLWRPSPGSVYPTLAQLEDEGLVRSAEADGARRFEITDAGRQHLETRAQEPAPWDVQDEGGHSTRDVKHLIAGVAAAAMQVAVVGDDGQRARAGELLAEVRRALYGILAQEARDTDADEPEASDSADSRD